MAQRWYVVRTKPQCEYMAAAALERDGFELFFPRVRTLSPKARHAHAPLFPGYLFLRHDLERRDGQSVRRLPGVLGWVHFDGILPPVPDEVVSDLARRLEAINSQGGLWTRFKAGEKVLVVSGKMESLAQVVEEPSSPQARVKVLLEFMGRQVPAQVPWHALRPAQQDGMAANDPNDRRGHRRTRGKGRWVQGFGPRAVAPA